MLKIGGKCDYGRKGTERCKVPGFENRGREPGAKECGQPLIVVKDKERDSSLEPPKSNTALPTV